ATLAPTAFVTCTGTHAITQADLNAGSFADTACVSSTTAGTNAPCASKTVIGNPNPHLLIIKDASPLTYSAVGDVITYTIKATNDGNVTLSGVSVTDTPALVNPCSTPARPATLAPTASVTCTGTHAITQADLDARSFVDTACVSSTTPNTNAPCARKAVTGNQNPHLVITTRASPATNSAGGQAITSTIVATDAGNVTSR